MTPFLTTLYTTNIDCILVLQIRFSQSSDKMFGLWIVKQALTVVYLRIITYLQLCKVTVFDTVISFLIAFLKKD